MKKNIWGVLPFLLLVSCSHPYIIENPIPTEQSSPIKLVQLSDIHFKSGKKIFENMVEKVNSLQSDIIVFTGDMVDNNSDIDAFFSCIGGITAACPKYAVLGNWEYSSLDSIEVFKTRLKNAGIILLVNESHEAVIKGRLISISALDDFLGGSPDVSKCSLKKESVNIILAHCPVLFDAVNAVKSDGVKFTMLCGHTHAGQVTFFGLPVFLPEGSGEYVSGFYYNGENTLYVSRGIGNSTIDIRAGSDPNIDVLYF